MFGVEDGFWRRVRREWEVVRWERDFRRGGRRAWAGFLLDLGFVPSVCGEGRGTLYVVLLEKGGENVGEVVDED